MRKILHMKGALFAPCPVGLVAVCPANWINMEWLAQFYSCLGNRTNLVKDDDLWWEPLVEDRVKHVGKLELTVKAGKVPEH